MKSQSRLFRSRLSLLQREQVFHLLLVAPAILVTAAFVAWPIFKLIQISLHELRLAELMRPITKPATLANFERVLGHPDLLRVLYVTVTFSMGSTIAAFLLGMASALALDATMPRRAALRTIIISPWSVAPVVASVVWMFMLDERVGLVNAIIHGANLSSTPVPFLNAPDLALITVTVVATWKEYPFFTVMLIAALQAIPRDLTEAAELDGARAWQIFRNVTWPLIRPTAAVATFLATLSAFRNVETILVMTGGGPARATETLAVRVYTETFRFLSPGTGAALGVLTLAIAIAVAAIFWPFIRERPR